MSNMFAKNLLNLQKSALNPALRRQFAHGGSSISALKGTGNLNFQKAARPLINRVLRRQMGQGGGIAGSNLPCPKCIGNPNRCTLMFILFFGPAFWIPCVAIVYLMHK